MRAGIYIPGEIMAAQAPTNNEFSLQCKQLINVLQKANRETDCALELHQKLAHVYRTKALGVLVPVQT